MYGRPRCCKGLDSGQRDALVKPVTAASVGSGSDPRRHRFSHKEERAQLDATQTHFEDWFRLGTPLAKVPSAGRSTCQERGCVRPIPLTTDNDIHATRFHGCFPEVNNMRGALTVPMGS